MASGNFERCLAVTLKWEGNYSNHPDDPGGPTMKGVIQREYDAWRKKQGKRPRPVRQIEESELQAIYRTEYWDAMGCEELSPGLDLCAFDAAVNSGVGRAKEWLTGAPSIDGICDRRLEFLQRLGRLWRVFGSGWRRRVAGIRAEAHRMAGQPQLTEAEDATLHAGMKCAEVRVLQQKLRTLGYPCGAVDGVYGEQTFRAVALFQQDHDLGGDVGVWLPAYQDTLDNAEPMLPKRKAATHKDLEIAGDAPVKHMNLLQRIFAWLFGASAAAQAFEGESVLDNVNGVRSVIEPVQGVLDWTSGNRWLIVALGCVAIIALIRAIRARHVEAYRNFGYQGPVAANNEAPKQEAHQ
jgi:lysozyme family protein